MKKIFRLSALIFILLSFPFFSKDFSDLNVDIEEPLHFNKWELLIYRSENQHEMNFTRCYLCLTDAETGEDVTFSKCKATYYYLNDVVDVPKARTRDFSAIFFRSAPRKVFKFRKKYYFDGGMVMHLLLKSGKYKISVFTPSDEHFFVKTPLNPEWKSNELYYDTENPASIVFLNPCEDENGFYSGGWKLSFYPE